MFNVNFNFGKVDSILSVFSLLSLQLGREGLSRNHMDKPLSHIRVKVLIGLNLKNISAKKSLSFLRIYPLAPL